MAVLDRTDRGVRASAGHRELLDDEMVASPATSGTSTPHSRSRSMRSLVTDTDGHRL
jgi:hypothetical protein